MTTENAPQLTINELMNMLNQRAPYTPEQEHSIEALIEAQQHVTRVIREQLTQNPIPHRVAEFQQRWPNTGTMWMVIVPTERTGEPDGEGRIGTLREHPSGGWQGRSDNDGYWRLPVHDNQDDAVLDVLTEHVRDRLRGF